jgi:hypothetical protein
MHEGDDMSQHVYGITMGEDAERTRPASQRNRESRGAMGDAMGYKAAVTNDDVHVQ